MKENWVYEFGRFRVDTLERALYAEGQPVSLPPKAIETLLLLLERPGSVVAKSDLLAAVWPNVFVEENNLTQYVSLLRKTLGDHRDAPEYIETVARRGYRFRFPVQRSVLTSGIHLGSEFAASLPPSEDIPTPTPPVSEPSGSHLLSRHWAIAAVAALAVGLALGFALARRSPFPLAVSAAAAPVSVAVLPCEMPATEPAASLAGKALADDLIRHLEDGRTNLRVLPATSSSYAGAGLQPMENARRLGVNFVVATKLEIRPDGAVMHARLVSARDGSVVWSEKVKGDAKNLLGLQDKLFVSLEKALVGSPHRDAAAYRHITLSLPAYEAYLRGLTLLDERTAEGVYKSIDALEQATAADPGFALAYAALADAYAFDFGDWRKSEATARKALALNPELGEAHASLGLVDLLWMSDLDRAAAEFRMAIRLNPGDASAHLWYADNFAAQGRLVEATEEMRVARDLDPYSEPINTGLCKMYYLAHEFDAAREQCRRTLELDPRFLEAHIVMHDIYIQTHEYDQAMAEFARLEELAGSSGLYTASRAQILSEAYAKDGIRGFWRARLDYLKEDFPDDYEMAKDFALLDRREDALASLRRANDAHKAGHLIMLFARNEPAFDAIRHERRFKELVEFN